MLALSVFIFLSFVYVLSPFGFLWFCFCLEGMHKKSVDGPRKPESEEKNGGWKTEHPDEDLRLKQVGQERNSTDQFSSMDNSEDIAIDLSSTAKHEKKSSTLRQCLSGGQQPKMKASEH